MLKIIMLGLIVLRGTLCFADKSYVLDGDNIIITNTTVKEETVSYHSKLAELKKQKENLTTVKTTMATSYDAQITEIETEIDAIEALQ